LGGGPGALGAAECAPELQGAADVTGRRRRDRHGRVQPLGVGLDLQGLRRHRRSGLDARLRHARGGGGQLPRRAPAGALLMAVTPCARLLVTSVVSVGKSTRSTLGPKSTDTRSVFAAAL